MVRRATTADLGLLLEAQAASHYEFEPSEPLAVASALTTGKVKAYILERVGCPVAVVSVAVEDEDALFCMFHRIGPANGLLSDCKELLGYVMDDLKELGVKKTALFVGMRNPRYRKLMRLYVRLGFKPDMTRMAGEV